MVTALQASWPTATPQALVLVSAGHSSTRSGGQVMVGFTVSRTVMVCAQEALLPHWSVAVQVRVSTRVAPQFVLTASLYVIVTALHPSWAVATPVTLVPVSVIGHSSTTLGGQVMVGFSVSRTVMVCRQLMLLLHASVAVQVRAITLAPPQLLLVTSL